MDREVTRERPTSVARDAAPDQGVVRRLNSFQKTMLQWDELHPYNAVHLVWIPQDLELERLTKIIRVTLESRGLTGLRLDRQRDLLLYQGGSSRCEVRVVSGEAGPESSLSAEVERELNTRFDTGGLFEPFRFLVVPGRGSFALGLVYFHPVAGAEPVALLLKDLVQAYRGQRGPESPMSGEVGPVGHESEPSPRRGSLRRGLLALPSLLRMLRTSCRPHFQDARNLHTEFTSFSLDAEELRAVLAAAKAWDVTVNDLFLAGLLQALSPRAVHRRQSRKRPRLSVGVIVNTRRDLGIADPRTFGLLLGSFVVSHEVPEGIGLCDLALAVRGQTARIKQAKLFLATPLQLAFVRGIWSFFSTKRRLGFYQKHYPLWGGITNMNLNTLWAPRAGVGPTDYLRAVSTGPATPLVLSITTVGDHANVGLSYRSTVFSASQVEQVQKGFLESMRQLQARP